ncbi:MAG: methyl-accepting chemotaxis protein, partial [Telluria sp.]
PSVRVTSVLNTNIADLRNLELQHILTSDDGKMTAYEQEIGKQHSTIKNNLASYERLISTPAERGLYEEFKKNWSSYQVQHQKALALSRAQSNDEAAAMVEGELGKTFAAVSANLVKLAELNVEGGKAASRAGDAMYGSSRTSIIALLVAVVLLGVGTAFFIARVISAPIAEAVDIAETVARGDLTRNIVVSSRDETGKLISALKEMNESLVRIVTEVRVGTETIAGASSQIASGNLDLSSRTEEQASSLEETAASMEEITTTVKNNADNAQQANQLAVSASEIAVKGGAVVDRVVETMASINASSNKIVDIISVIDGIAFQTNILALNAAVEAARAGEQGRGFAVVASEVRNLAQRSAAAAKEIKALINDSVEQVATGGKFVNDAGATMGEIVASVRRVTDIMAEIKTASAEQSDGIDQVNQAIGQMDEVTQQNAALVEEAASAAEAMQTQAAKLAQVVSVFKLSAGDTQALALEAPVQVKRPVAVVKKAPIAKPQPTPRLVAAGGRGEDDWEQF